MSGTIQALDLPFDAAIDFLRQKTNITTERWSDVWRAGHDRGFMVAGAASEALVQDFRGAVARAIETGGTLADFRRDFELIADQHGWEYTGTPGWRSRIIYETNLSTAYAAGRYAELTEPDTLAVFPFWQYVHSGAAHPRLDHLGWNGLVLRADDPWWSTHYPPNGWRCGCTVRPVMQSELRRMGKRGPDAAPPLEPRTVRVPGRGSVEVPKGIDPGWDYNPGAAWKRGEVKPPGEPRQVEPPAPPIPQPPAFTPRAYPDRSDANAGLTAAHRPWFDTLGKDEVAALEAYKGLGARSINRALRGELDNAALRDTGELLDRAVQRATAPHDLVVFRRVSGAELEQLRRLSVGEEWRARSLVSSSIDRETIEALIKDATTVEIRIPAAQPGAAYVHPFPKFHFRQYEMLLSRRSVFRLAERDADRLVLERTHVDLDR